MISILEVSVAVAIPARQNYESYGRIKRMQS